MKSINLIDQVNFQGGCFYPPVIDDSGKPGTIFGPTVYNPEEGVLTIN